MKNLLTFLREIKATEEQLVALKPALDILYRHPPGYFHLKSGLPKEYKYSTNPSEIAKAAFLQAILERRFFIDNKYHLGKMGELQTLLNSTPDELTSLKQKKMVDLASLTAVYGIGNCSHRSPFLAIYLAKIFEENEGIKFGVKMYGEMYGELFNQFVLTITLEGRGTFIVDPIVDHLAVYTETYYEKIVYERYMPHDPITSGTEKKAIIDTYSSTPEDYNLLQKVCLKIWLDNWQYESDFSEIRQSLHRKENYYFAKYHPKLIEDEKFCNETHQFFQACHSKPINVIFFKESTWGAAETISSTPKGGFLISFNDKQIPVGLNEIMLLNDPLGGESIDSLILPKLICSFSRDKLKTFFNLVNLNDMLEELKKLVTETVFFKKHPINKILGNIALFILESHLCRHDRNKKIRLCELFATDFNSACQKTYDELFKLFSQIIPVNKIPTDWMQHLSHDNQMLIHRADERKYGFLHEDVRLKISQQRLAACKNHHPRLGADSFFCSKRPVTRSKEQSKANPLMEDKVSIGSFLNKRKENHPIVCISGLTSEKGKQYNGKKGRCVSQKIKENGEIRYGVKLTPESKPILLKLENLELVKEPLRPLSASPEPCSP